MLIMMLKQEIIVISLEDLEALHICRISQPKNYNFHPIMQKVGKFSLKINASPNRLEKYMSFTINNKFLAASNF